MSAARAQLDERVLTITLDRPARKNALTFALYGELRALFTSLRDDEGVNTIVLAGAGGNFCSGGDVHE
ncbi:MAG: enoyl-CoA hydratase-related protein, partial [Candidatus Cybelea sp.]